MLVYHPAVDVNHGIFRAILLHKHVYGNDIESDYWRLLDFLYLFPHKVENIRVPRPLVAARRELALMERKYNDVNYPREFLVETMPIHSSILRILCAKRLIRSDELEIGKITWDADDFPASFIERVRQRSIENAAIISFLKNLVETVPFLGPDGIKSRSGWMEHRYDA